MISGYERNVEEARRTIQQLVAELQEMVSQDVHLDPRTHARIIGARGKAIRKLMEEFKVWLRLGRKLLLFDVKLSVSLVAFRWIFASLRRARTNPIK